MSLRLAPRMFARARAPTMAALRQAAPRACVVPAASVVKAGTPSMALDMQPAGERAAALAAMASAGPARTPTRFGYADASPAESVVFEFGLSFVASHYSHALISLMRNLFQTFRPILILFVFGQIVKAAFMLMGAPMLFSFYSIWMFEVFYGLVQCVISFIFVGFFYNNLA